MNFPLYQRLHRLFDWIFNGFDLFPAPLSIGRSFFFVARAGWGPAGPGGAARAQKCFDQLMKGRGKGQIHWISNQIISAIVGKGENPLTIHSNDWDQGIWKRAKGMYYHIFAYWSHMLICSFNLERCLCTSSIVSFVPQSPSRGNTWWKNVACESKVACTFSEKCSRRL